MVIMIVVIVEVINIVVTDMIVVFDSDGGHSDGYEVS